jgi:hypothetical protein
VHVPLFVMQESLIGIVSPIERRLHDAGAFSFIPRIDSTV